MANNELTLDQRLAVLLVALEESQAVSLALQEGLSAEREALSTGVAAQLKALEAERKKLTDELPRAIAGETRQAAERMVSILAQLSSKKFEEHNAPLLDAIKGAVKEAGTATQQANKALVDLRTGRKESTLNFLYLWGMTAASALVLILLFFVLIWRGNEADNARQSAIIENTAQLEVKYNQMKAEMEAWEAAGLGHFETEACPQPDNPRMLCIRVDKKRGSFGKNKDFYVPAKPFGVD
jgi:hypothetical protein